jgi:hypothetical protein
VFEAPDGRARWTLNLLAGEMVHLTSFEALSRDTVARRLDEMAIKPWQEGCGAFRRSTPSTWRGWKTYWNGTLRHPDPLRPVVCFDETPRQLIAGATR